MEFPLRSFTIRYLDMFWRFLVEIADFRIGRILISKPLLVDVARKRAALPKQLLIPCCLHLYVLC